MKIKTKLSLALGLLFILILALSGLAIRQVNLLAQDTKNILVANYISMDYSRNMYKLLDQNNDETSLQKFQAVLDKQKSNITEVGEDELTANLQEDFNILLQNPNDNNARIKVRSDLNSIMKLNMDAIKYKSNKAELTAENSVLWISVTSSFCLIIGFTLIVNLPGYIANPIRDLTESIKEIAAKNYSRRVKVNGNDEFSVLTRSFNTMAQKLQEYNDSNLSRLMMEKMRIETLISNLHDPVIGLDEKYNILFINDEALKISGLKKDVVLGKPSQQIALHNDLIRSLLQHLTQHDAKEKTLKIYADNKESYFEKQVVPINIVPTGETESREIGSFILLKNVTPYKELDFAKTNFIATVSHEFKTPIAAMKMSLQLLENRQTGSLNQEQQDLLKSINDDTDRLLRTTGELLNITQVETGKTSINRASFNVNDSINDVIESNRIAALTKNITITHTNSGTLPNINADEEKVKWVISNLLSNAIRYSYENSAVNIAATANSSDIKIRVKDNGPGIPQNYISKIFDKYFRVPGTQKEGTGLGLAISKEYIEAMGGTISVESEPGNGSTFTITLTGTNM